LLKKTDHPGDGYLQDIVVIGLPISRRTEFTLIHKPESIIDQGSANVLLSALASRSNSVERFT
jgi:hypothetical protein